MSRVVIYIANPALILNTVTSGQISGSKKIVVYIMGLAILYYILVPILAKILAKIMPFSRKAHGTYEAMYTFSNLGFMGIPVLNAVYGPESIFYLTSFLVTFNIVVYTYGTILLSEGKSATIDWKKICNPVAIGAVIALTLFFLDIKTPYVLNETISLLGGITTPLAMITIGSSLSFIPMKEVFFDWKMYVFALGKLLVLPVVTYFVFLPFINDKMLLGVMVVISGMPVASNVSLLCNEYGGDSYTVTKGTFITTMLAMLTIPILAATIL